MQSLEFLFLGSNSFCLGARGLLRALLENVIAQLSGENFPRKLYLVFISFISGNFYEVSPVLSSCYVLFQKMILDTSGAGAQGGGAHGCNPAVGYGAFTAWVLLSQNEISAYFD